MSGDVGTVLPSRAKVAFSAPSCRHSRLGWAAGNVAQDWNGKMAHQNANTQE